MCQTLAQALATGAKLAGVLLTVLLSGDMAPRGPWETSGVRRTNQPSALQRRTSVLGVAALLAMAACLNPMPEEFPSERDPLPSGSAGGAAGPTNAGGSGIDSENSGSGAGAGTGGPTPDLAGGGAGGTSGAYDPDSSDAPDAGSSSPADGGSEVDDASP